MIFFLSWTLCMCELARACICFLGSPVVLWNNPQCAANSYVCYFLGRSLPFLTAIVCTDIANIPWRSIPGLLSGLLVWEGAVAVLEVGSQGRWCVMTPWSYSLPAS